jgi:hypothetical protein
MSDEKKPASEQTTEPPPKPHITTPAVPGPAALPSPWAEISQLRTDIQEARRCAQNVLLAFAKFRKEITDGAFANLQAATRLEANCEELSDWLARLDTVARAIESKT